MQKITPSVVGSFYPFFLFVGLYFIFSPQLISQDKYTMYDTLPGVPAAYKPNFQPTFPNWGRMLYEDSLNYNEVNKLFEEWEVHKSQNFRPLRRYFLLWRQAVAAYADPNGKIRIPDIRRENQLTLSRAKDRIIHPTQSSNTNEETWQFLGPKETFWMAEERTPYRGPCSWQVNVYSFDVSQSNPNILYSGTETGYLNKTEDKGISWRPIGLDYLFGGGIKAVAVHPEDPDIVFASAGRYIHKTEDGGLSWRKVHFFFPNTEPERIEISKSNPRMMIASSLEGLFVSKDGGDTWIKKWELPTYDAHFVSDAQIYCISEDIDGNTIIALSENSGDSFFQDPSFPQAVKNQDGLLLASTGENATSIFAMILGLENTPMIYKKDLESREWQKLAEGNSASFPMDNGQGYYDMVLEVDPNDESIIYAGTVTLYQSDNGGISWKAIGGYQGDFPIHPDMQDIKVNGDGEVWVATDGGFTLSTDHFGSPSNAFALNNGLMGSDMWGFDMGWNEDLIVGGRYHNGNMAIGDPYEEKSLRIGGAESPTGWILSGKSRHAVFDDLGGGWILPPDIESPSAGRFIFSKYPNMDEYGSRRSNLIQHPLYYEHIYLGSENGIWLSKDLGENFVLLKDFGSKVRYFTISHADPNVLYADIVSQGLFKSIDGGYTWTHLDSEPYFSRNGGRFFISISPTDPDRIYVCLQNGLFSTDLGKVFSSDDGGISWKEITAGLEIYSKCIVTQPNTNGGDIIYLFSLPKFGKPAEVFVKTDQDSIWSKYDSGLPVNFDIIYAQPFYKEGKLRIAGNAGIWEAPLLINDYAPIVRPWLPGDVVNCPEDTIQLEDHSIVDHDGVQWHWTIYPEPEYISNTRSRNPKVVFGKTQSYYVKSVLEKDGKTFEYGGRDLIRFTPCSSVENCDYPGVISPQSMSILDVSSEEPLDNGQATNAIDGDVNTIWHTSYILGADPYPHYMQIDLGDDYVLSEFIYQPRLQGTNGTIKDYQLYLSDAPNDLGNLISEGAFESNTTKKTVKLEKPSGRYLTLRALSEINNNTWASAAEIQIRACLKRLSSSILSVKNELLEVFPIPSSGRFYVPIPLKSEFDFIVYDFNGRVLRSGTVKEKLDVLKLDMYSVPNGTYLVALNYKNGVTYNAKLLKH